MEIKNKMTVTRGEVEGDNRGKKWKGRHGTCIKNPWTKTMEGRIECRKWEWIGQGRVIGGKWGQL